MLKSTPEQVKNTISVLAKYLRLPFSEENIPGAIMEHVFAHARKSQVLNTYDFVDIVDTDNKLGWQVKSTKDSTPVTWKRAKIPNSQNLIEESFKSAKGLQNLGDAIIDFCNGHALESMDRYGLDQLGYVRLIMFPDKVQYFERKLCDRENPIIFDKTQYIWHWSEKKNTTKKRTTSSIAWYR